MSDNNVTRSGGITFFGALGILFIGLKLAGIIDWSWWLVLLPLYGPLVAVLALVLLILLGAAIVSFVGAIVSRATR